MKNVLEYWAQITVLLGTCGFILKTILESRYKTKELKFKYFFEIKFKKIIEIYSKIVEIQMIIDRRKTGGERCFETNMFKKRIALDQFYWESDFYLSDNTKKIFRHFLKWLPMFEQDEIIKDSPEIETQFEEITNVLIAEFRKEIK